MKGNNMGEDFDAGIVARVVIGTESFRLSIGATWRILDTNLNECRALPYEVH